MNNSIKEKLASFKILLDKELEDYFQKQKEFSKSYSPLTEKIFDSINNLALPNGKRLRGSLTYYSYILFGGQNKQEALQASLAIELMQLYLIIEDDFMDETKRRRGGKSLNELYKTCLNKNLTEKESESFANSMAVDIGLMVNHLTMQKLSSLKFKPELVVKAMKYYNNHLITTTIGQAHDIASNILEELTVNDVLNTLKWKTATYSYENPLHIGAILAGASEEDLNLLTDYATPAGIAFQIQDDILGMFGSEKKTGKPNTTDLSEGKMTSLILKALEKGSDEEKDIINSALGNENVTDKQHQQVKDIITSTGSLQYSKDLAEKYVKKALKVVEELEKKNLNQEGLDFLKGIAEYMINREL